MPAFVSNLTIEKGTDFEQDFQIFDDNGSPLNLTGCDAFSKIRKHITAEKFNTFTVEFVDRSKGKIRILMNNQTSSNLKLGRNVYDVFILDTNNKLIKVVEGTIIVNGSATYGRTPENQIGNLGEVDTENVQDGQILMYNEEEQKLEFVDPDKVLEKSAEDEDLPDEFINVSAEELAGKVGFDGGEY